MDYKIDYLINMRTEKLYLYLKPVIDDMCKQYSYPISDSTAYLNIIEKYKKYLTDKYENKDIILDKKTIEVEIKAIICVFIDELEYDDIVNFSENNTSGESCYTDDDERAYINEINKIPILTIEEEKTLFLKIKQGDEEARKKIIESNLRLVASFVRKYKGRGIPFLDLVQEGNLGLIKAIDRFDISKGYKFSTYAWKCINNEIIKFISKQLRGPHCPVNIYQDIKKLNKKEEELTNKLGRNPKISELASAMGVSEQRIKVLEDVNKNVLSLNVSISNDEETKWIDTIEDKTELSVEDIVINKFIKEDLTNLYNQVLTPREKEVFLLKHLSEEGAKRTFSEIGEILNISQQRASKLNAKATKKLKQTPFIKNYNL